MADRPIIFSAPIVRALLDGRKTQTRRVLKPQPPPSARYAGVRFATGLPDCWFFNPPFAVREVYAVGDRLWVREAWCTNFLISGGSERTPAGCHYRADGKHVIVDDGDGYAVLNKNGTEKSPWRPSIHMPRWASRLTLTVTDVRVQRLQEISEEDAWAEGLEWAAPTWGVKGLAESWNGDPRLAFAALWNSLHGPAAWDANPWVAAITFTVERRNIDAREAA